MSANDSDSSSSGVINEQLKRAQKCALFITSFQDSVTTRIDVPIQMLFSKIFQNWANMRNVQRNNFRFLYDENFLLLNVSPKMLELEPGVTYRIDAMVAQEGGQ